MKKFFFEITQSWIKYSVWAISCFLIFKFIVLVGVNLIQELPLPGPNDDQYGYMLMGKYTAELDLYAERSPIYSIWMSLIYQLLPKNMLVFYHYEKIISISIFAILTFVLGIRMFNKWTALFFFGWVWNCKYLILESNGSHLMATNFLMLALIFMSIQNKNISQIYILMLFFSAGCRSEMWLVLILFFAFNSFYQFKNFKFHSISLSLLKKPRNQIGILILLIALALQFYFSVKKVHEEPERFSVAFMQNFATNYVERNKLNINFPDKWGSTDQIIQTNFPGVKSPLELAINYPEEIIYHIFYNFSLFKYFPAIVIGSLNYVCFIILIICWFFTLVIFKETDYLLNKEQKYLLNSTLVLLPISLIFMVAMRYYIQIIPLIIIAFTIVCFQLLNKLKVLFRSYKTTKHT